MASDGCRRPPARSENGSGIPLKPCYDAADVPAPAGVTGGNEPGAFPFRRGTRADGYRGRLWTMRQYAGFATAAESNARYRYLLARGTTGLSVAFDLPTQLGYDSDAPPARGEVGKVGVAIDHVRDMETLFDAIPLDHVTVSMTINAPASILLALLLAVARRRGIPFAALGGTIQNDVLKEYVARGTYIFPPGPSMRLVTDVMAYCAAEVPQWNTISISGYHIREAGSTAVEEIAFTLSNAKAYLRAAQTAGLAIDEIAPRMSFFWNAHNDLFEEIAKFRAARELWASIVRDEFGSRDPRSQMLRFHTQTGGSTLTAQEPDNNIVRVTLQALAAVLGGTQSLHTNGKDEALALPTAQAARLALRTQQIIAYESGVADVVDPLGGSYYVESLTSALAERARALIREVDDLGGSIAAIESGWMQGRVADSAYHAQEAIERAQTVVVGVNAFAETEADTVPIELQRIDPALERAQVERVQRYRAERDASLVAGRLDDVRRAAEGSTNLMPRFVEAVDAGATLGEICDVLRAVFGRHVAFEVVA
ncbi:MAG: methylmalonyl-CoA mutase [Candidatus Eremiobacteraeota bacterium]|nr:methylmalonyl-CoA mutase [Candidatus Eremiobacteraeota bacterium]MBC5802499.1 methylmalonyl-CoA mutase [Candidatus Eremiobacteraeota bacterium]MBC5821601.1 methylmalonyl-CoA mutase [Candidatus Eremiobacteraeota bacterium]